MMRRKFELPEKIICNAVTVYRERGKIDGLYIKKLTSSIETSQSSLTIFSKRTLHRNYLQRLEQFEKAILAYDEAIRLNPSDVRSLLGRSLARVKATHYNGALADAVRAAGCCPQYYLRGSFFKYIDIIKNPDYTISVSRNVRDIVLNYDADDFEMQKIYPLLDILLCYYTSCTLELEPTNLAALQIKAKTEYEKCAFERSLVLANCGQVLRILPPDFAECARCAEETIRECSGPCAKKVMKAANSLFKGVDIRDLTKEDIFEPKKVTHRRRMLKEPTQRIQETSRLENQKYEQISRLMASKYLEQMAHDKQFLISLCKDERLSSANKQGSQMLIELTNKARADIEKRQAVLRERRPLYAARAAEATARARLTRARKERLGHAQKQHAVDARRLVRTTKAILEDRNTSRCLEAAEFAMEQISRKPINLLPDKEKFLLELYNIVANAFLHQKKFKENMSEAEREKRAFVLLGISVSREPSHDSILRTRPMAPPRDVRRRLRTLERMLSLNGRASERCYILHELARIHIDTKHPHKARVYAHKGQAAARSADQRIWLLNLTFLLARCHLLQNNRPEARAALIEGAGLARSFGITDAAIFFDTCVNISAEGEVGSTEALIDKREKAMIKLMQDDDLKAAAQYLFKRMSVIPASRRFSVIPGAHMENNVTSSSFSRRASIVPESQQPTRVNRKAFHPLGFQEFDF